MAKLVDLLAKHLKEWPDGAKEAMQNPKKSSHEYMRVYFYGGCGDDFDFDLSGLAEDASHACVTKSQYLAARDRLHAETVKRMSEVQCTDFDKGMIDDIAKRLFSIWTSPCSSKETWQLEAGLAYDAADAFMAERAKRIRKS